MKGIVDGKLYDTEKCIKLGVFRDNKGYLYRASNGDLIIHRTDHNKFCYYDKHNGWSLDMLNMNDKQLQLAIEYGLIEVVPEYGQAVGYFEVYGHCSFSEFGNILFNDKRQLLSTVNGSYRVLGKNSGQFKDYHSSFVWVSCAREYLKFGDTAYHSDIKLDSEPYFTDSSKVVKILDSEVYCYVCHGCFLGKRDNDVHVYDNIIVSNIRDKYWYKLVRKSDLLKD